MILQSRRWVGLPADIWAPLLADCSPKSTNENRTPLGLTCHSLYRCLSLQLSHQAKRGHNSKVEETRRVSRGRNNPNGELAGLTPLCRTQSSWIRRGSKGVVQYFAVLSSIIYLRGNLPALLTLWLLSPTRQPA